jgi:ubiquinone/menaquinone biosynthesis C-methylase UbiE
MERTPEPELMDDPVQAAQYAGADFEEPHSRVIELFCRAFEGREIMGHVLDLGCGPGDVTLRFARRFPRAQILAIDGSAQMIRLARERQEREKAGLNITFSMGIIPGAELPDVCFEALISSSFLHHLHHPKVLWELIRDHALPGTLVFVVDLMRPSTRQDAMALVERYAANEPDVLRADFYNSLLAAFTPEEVRAQLDEAGLTELEVEVVSDRHLLISGTRKG